MASPSKLTAWERWELASFNEGEGNSFEIPETPPAKDEVVPVAEEPRFLPSAEEIELIQRQAREDGRRQGYEEGRQAGFLKGQEEGKSAVSAEAEKLSLAAAKLDTALAGLDAKIADELLALSVEIAREVVRQEITAHPETILSIVREALSHLPHQHAVIYLNPEDASLLRSYMGDQLGHAGHRIQDDFKLKRGDCILEAGNSQIDAGVAMRWRRVVANLGLATAWQSADTGVVSGADDES